MKDALGNTINVGDIVFCIDDRDLYYVVNIFKKDIQVSVSRVPLHRGHTPPYNYIKVNKNQAYYIGHNVPSRDKR